MSEHTIATIDTHELKNLLDNEPNLCLIDVREQEEWDEAHIPGAIHIPKGELTTKINAYMADKNHPLYLHCKGGVRSMIAAQWLMDMGYQEVYSVDGGISEWMVNGYPVTR
jgi:rhodanese-related sulfurtransferase